MDPAKDFLLTAAKRSLDQAFEGHTYVAVYLPIPLVTGDA